MKESDFINQNKIKWVEVEKNLTNNELSPSDTSKLFVQVTDDLSYARTFYKNRSVKIYLNEIAKFLFNDINKSKQHYLKSFLGFWKTDLPLVMYVSRRSMLISFIVFVSCFTLGVITSRYDPNFCRSILSSNYIDMTNENIAKGDPMAVYKSRGELETFLPIFVNNIKIDFITFFSGIFMAIGSLFIMVVNGVMVGVFQYFFITKGLFWESFLAIWTHGTLEISAIILSGGAGLTLGKGLLFPGTYSRFHALKESGMNGLKIIMGVAPVTLLAAFIEGFLTRHTNIPDVIRFLFILLSLAFVLIYFFWYPRRVAKNMPNPTELVEINPVFKNHKTFEPSEILSGGELMTQTFRVFLKNFRYLGGLIFGTSFILAILISIDTINLFSDSAVQWLAPVDFFNYLTYPLLAIISLICFVFIEYKNLLFLRVELHTSDQIYQKQQLFYSVLTFSLVFVGFMAVVEDGFKLFAFILLPVFSLISSIVVNQNVSFLKGINLMSSLLNKQWGTFILGTFFSFIITWIVFLTLAYGTKYLFLENALLWMLTDDDVMAGKIRLATSVFQISVSFFFYITLNSIFNSLFFYTLKEINTAENLITRISQIKAAK
ncbi:MAG: stage II sporulation protein M [Bacteroidetes bacterium]|nr:stage II sporulation protein M [Bacteroidota bacterium]